MVQRTFVAARDAARSFWAIIGRLRLAILVGLALLSGLFIWGAPAAAATGSPIGPKAAGSVAPDAPDRSPVGFEAVRVPNGSEPPLLAGVWYPTSAEPQDVPLENFTQRVAPSGPVEGRALPLIVISHGGGGSGFMVAAVSHAGDTYDDQSKVLMLWRRPAQLSRLIDFMLQDWRGHSAIDPQRIGAFGFSNGGFAVLVEAGAKPELGRIDPYCAANPQHDLCTTLAKACLLYTSDAADE